MATLVTGGAGYIGSHTTVTLHDAGRDPVVLDDFSNASRRVVDALRGLTRPDLPVVEGDVGDADILDAVFGGYRIDSVVHFAARKSVAESVSDPLGYYRSNLGSTIALAAAAIDRGVRRLVFSSSATVYGSTSALPVTEDSPTVPESPYGETKLMGERILADAAAASELTAVMLRYFNPVGAHPSGLIGEDPSGEPRASWIRSARPHPPPYASRRRCCATGRSSRWPKRSPAASIVSPKDSRTTSRAGACGPS